MPKPKVLVADDDRVYVEAVTAVLETQFDVVTSFSGTEALEKAARELPDVIVLDVMMDHLSEGFDVARKLKRDPLTRDIPLIMLTAVDEVYNYRMEIEESYVPYDRYLEKPIEPEHLLTVIDEVITAPVR